MVTTPTKASNPIANPMSGLGGSSGLGGLGPVANAGIGGLAGNPGAGLGGLGSAVGGLGGLSSTGGGLGGLGTAAGNLGAFGGLGPAASQVNPQARMNPQQPPSQQDRMRTGA